MHRTPIVEAPRYPVTVGTSLVAIGITLAFWSGGDVAALMADPTNLPHEPWRLVTSILPHGDLFHLLFNVYWLWVFGAWLERAFGHAAMALLVVSLAAVSSAAQLALSDGGIGLSGVGYGLLGFLWCTERYDRRYRDAMDARTMQLFLAWGVLCFVLTAVGVWRIANAAHVAGLVFGAGLGAARAWRGKRRWAAVAGLVAGCALVAAAATTLRPWLAFADRSAASHCYQGFRALEAQDDARALWLLERAVAYPEVSAGCMYNYGIALQRNGREAEADVVHQRAVKADPELGRE